MVGMVSQANDKAELAALDPTNVAAVICQRSTWRKSAVSDNVALIGIDTSQGICVQSTFDPNVVWLRDFSGGIFYLDWWDIDPETDNYARANSAFQLSTLFPMKLVIPGGWYPVSQKISVTTTFPFIVSGLGKRASVLVFNGDSAGLEFISPWGPNNSQKNRGYFGCDNFSVLTSNIHATETAVRYKFPYLGSSQHSEGHFRDMEIGVVDSTNSANQGWQQGFVDGGGWNLDIRNNTINQRENFFGSGVGSAYVFNGLSAACKIHGGNAQWWSKSIAFGNATLLKLVGTVSGSFQYGEQVLWSSGAQSGYVARTDGYGSSNLCVADFSTPTVANGTVITGQTSGATITLTAAATVITQGNEGLSVINSDFVGCDYGVYAVQPPGTITQSVGLWVTCCHFNVAYNAIITDNFYQPIISSNLIYTQLSGGVDISISNGADGIVSSNILTGGAGLNRTGLGFNGGLSHRADGNSISGKTIGISGSVTTGKCTVGANTLHDNTTNIIWSGPQWPSANFNELPDSGWISGGLPITTSNGALANAWVNARWRKRGKSVDLIINGTIILNGNGKGYLIIGLPNGVPAANYATFSGRGRTVFGAAINGLLNPGDASMIVVTASATYPGVDGYTFNLSGTYEIA